MSKKLKERFSFLFLFESALLPLFFIGGGEEGNLGMSELPNSQPLSIPTLSLPPPWPFSWWLQPLCVFVCAKSYPVFPIFFTCHHPTSTASSLYSPGLYSLPPDSHPPVLSHVCGFFAQHAYKLSYAFCSLDKHISRNVHRSTV